jgi:hypothetical protein
MMKKLCTKSSPLVGKACPAAAGAGKGVDCMKIQGNIYTNYIKKCYMNSEELDSYRYVIRAILLILYGILFNHLKR